MSRRFIDPIVRGYRRSKVAGLRVNGRSDSELERLGRSIHSLVESITYACDAVAKVYRSATRD